MSVNKYQLKKGINLYHIPTKKFKTTSVSIYFQRPLCREEATKNALLSSMLRRASGKYPTSQAFSRRLEDLYDAVFYVSSMAKGERQILNVQVQFINDKFIEENVSLGDQVFDFIDDAVFGQKEFSEDYLNQEKENLRQLILSNINDKKLYASKRCTEIMCEGEAYSISSNGYIEDLEGITKEDLFDYYKNVILKSPIDIFVNGDIDIDAIKGKFEYMVKNIDVTNRIDYPDDVKKVVKEVKNVTEEQPVTQGKLSMGFRTNIFITDHDYPALMIYNAVLGCGITSKLFNNVREKLSLCYYASSNIDSLKGLMKINSGIEVVNYKKAYDEILKQIKDIENGEVSDYELEAGKLSTIDSLNSITDRTFLLNNFYMNNIIAECPLDIDDLISKIKGVTKEQVVAVSKKICLDTVFFLKGREA